MKHPSGSITHRMAKWNSNKWFEEVVKTADEIQGYTLVEGPSAYRNLFLQKNPNSTEVVLAVTLDADLQVFSSRNRRVISPTYGQTGHR